MHFALTSAFRRHEPATLLSCYLLLAGTAILVHPAAQADLGLRPPAAATTRTAEGDSIEFGIYDLTRYDSNLFRLQDNVEPNGNERRSAGSTTTGAGLHIDKSYGLQRLRLNATVTYDHYAPYGNLDFTNTQFDVTYQWSVTPSITGDIIINHDRFANDYEYVGFRTKPDPRKIELERLDVDWRAGAALHPRLSVFRREDTNSSRTFQLENSRSNSVEASLVYTLRSKNTLSVYDRRASGDATNNSTSNTRFLDKHFDEDEYGAAFTWETIGLVTIDTQVGFRQRIYNTFSQRDFRGLVGNLAATYTPTGKVTILLFASRGLASSQTADSSFYVNEIATLSLAYNATTKVTVKPSFSYKRQDFRGAPLESFFALRESTRYRFVEVDWSVLRSVDLALEVGRATRQSNLSVLQYADTSASAFARFKF